MTTPADPAAIAVAHLRGGAATAAPLHLRLLSKAKVDDNGCWIWQRECRPSGYGVLVMDGRRHSAHRVAYELFVGPIPDGLHIDHLCRVRRFVNPAHLEAVTPRENVLRSPIAPPAINARATHCKYGHAFDAENTYVDRDGHRNCRICSRAKTSRLRAHYGPERRATHVAEVIAYKRQLAEETQRTATRGGEAWTPELDAQVLRSDLTRKEIAVLLGRTFSAVCQRRAKLRNRLGIAS